MSIKTYQGLVRPLTPGELNRLSRYASWIRRLVVYEWDLSEEITQLFVPVAPGSAPILPLRLRELDWSFHESNLSFFPKFLSPSLTKIVVTTNSGGSWDKQAHSRMMSTMRLAILMFPSSLQCLHLRSGYGPRTHFTKEISAFILRCGKPLQEFKTNLVLSTQAIVHLMNLPNLHTWVTEQGPPQVTDLINHGVPDGSTSIFPSLETLELKGGSSFEWLSLFEASKKHTPPWNVAGDRLSVFTYSNYAVSIDSDLLARLPPFPYLTYVSLEIICSSRPCASKFTDKDVESLAIALPNLQTLKLGKFPCNDGTCPTTVRSLLSLSIHCRELRTLCIHFLTQNLGADMLNLLNYAYSQDLHLKPKCTLEMLATGEMSFQFADHELVLISIGMLMIFPQLARFKSSSCPWALLEVTMKAFERSRELLGTATVNLMRCFNEAKEQAERGSPLMPSVVSSLFPSVKPVSSSRPFNYPSLLSTGRNNAHYLRATIIAPRNGGIDGGFEEAKDQLTIRK